MQDSILRETERKRERLCVLERDREKACKKIERASKREKMTIKGLHTPLICDHITYLFRSTGSEQCVTCYSGIQRSVINVAAYIQTVIIPGKT